MKSKYVLACAFGLILVGVAENATMAQGTDLVNSASSVSLEKEIETATNEAQNEEKAVEADKGNDIASFSMPFINLGKNERTKAFLEALKKISDTFEKDAADGNPWSYSLKHNQVTFGKQLECGHRITNGGLLPTWGLADCGIFKNNERLNTNKKGQPHYFSENNTSATMEKCSEIIYFKEAADKLIKANKLEPGDIVHFCHDHSSIYAGNSCFFDASLDCGNACYTKDGTVYFKSLYTTLKNPSEKITAVTRLNDPDKKQEEQPNIVASNGKYDFSDLKGKQNVTNFCEALRRLSDILQADYKAGKGWYWSDQKNKKTFEGQLADGRRISNCGIYISWALAEIGVYTHGEAMYIGYTNKKTVKNSKGKKMEPDLGLDYYKIVYHDPSGSKTGRQLLSAGKIKKGDIVLYRLHVNAYAGNNMWWDAGRGTGNTVHKNGKYYFNGCRSKHGDLGARVYYIIRLKDQS